jgi:hypothetical protein
VVAVLERKAADIGVVTECCVSSFAACQSEAVAGQWVKQVGEKLEMVQRYTRSVSFEDSLRFYKGPLS